MSAEPREAAVDRRKFMVGAAVATWGVLPKPVVRQNQL